MESFHFGQFKEFLCSWGSMKNNRRIAVSRELTALGMAAPKGVKSFRETQTKYFDK